MGADMMGYLVKGPAKLSKVAIARAKKEYWALCQEMNKEGQRKCLNCERLVGLGEERCETCGDPLHEWPRTKAEADTEVNNMAADWLPSYRDVACRSDPDDPEQFLVFAGDMSYGDAPEGAGYKYLQELLTTGIGKALGIR